MGTEATSVKGLSRSIWTAVTIYLLTSHCTPANILGNSHVSVIICIVINLILIATL